MAQSKKKTKKSGKKSNSILDKIRDEWEESEPSMGGDYEELPDGAYQVRIDVAQLDESKSSGRAQIKFEFTVVSGEFANRKCWKYDGLDNAKSISYTRGGLARLGIEIEDLENLEEALSELVGTFATINIKTKGEYTNVYFKEALDDDEVDLDDLDEVDEDEEEVEVEEDEDEEEVEEDEEDEDYEPSKGDVVEVDGYTGTVLSVVIKKKTAKVDFGEDGIEVCDWADMTLSEGEEEGEDEDEDEVEEDEEGEEGEEDEEGEEEGVVLKVKTVTAAQKKKLHAIAKKHDVDPKMYDSAIELAADVAEYLGMTGEYSNGKKFFKELEAADE